MNTAKWYGTLSVANIENVVKQINELLSGKSYSFVSAYEYRRFEPEIRTGQQLRDKYHLWYGDNNEYAGFNFSDTYGVWGLSTNNQDGKYDPTFRNPYVEIGRDEIMITQRTGEGRIAYWLIRVENDNDN